MKIEDILKLSIDDQIAELQKKPDTIKVKYTDCEKQYKVKMHDVYSTTLRPSKQVKKKDENGEEITSYVEPARLGVSFQEIIVSRAAAFLINDGIGLNPTLTETEGQQTVYEMIKATSSDNKLDYRTRAIARYLFSECEVAELWYFVEDTKGLWNWLKSKISKVGIGSAKYMIRMKILANSLGDSLWPYFNETGDLVAFGRGYTVKIGNESTDRFDVYTADKIILYAKVAGQWVLADVPKANLLGKIPVIYYSQPYPEWYAVQSLIDRYEATLSNFSDSIDYFGAPDLVLTGEVTGLNEKQSMGKVIQLTGDGADARYLTWDQAPEAIKLELETLKNLIFSLTQTPDISFEQVKNLGSQISGIAIKMMFADAHLKAMSHQEVFGEMIQRRLNLLMAAIGNVIAVKYKADVDLMDITPVFNLYMPSNDKEIIENLLLANGNKPIISQKTSIKLSPFDVNADDEIAAIEEDEKKAMENQLQGSFNILNQTEQNA
jgi:SPP1 family phage portal protein